MDFILLQEAALRTFHINDDCTKYCITVPTDDGRNEKNDSLSMGLVSNDALFVLVGGDQPLDEANPMKALRKLSGRTLNVYIRYKERGDIGVDHARVYPGILKYVRATVRSHYVLLSLSRV